MFFIRKISVGLNQPLQFNFFGTLKVSEVNAMTKLIFEFGIFGSVIGPGRKGKIGFWQLRMTVNLELHFGSSTHTDDSWFEKTQTGVKGNGTGVG